MEWRVVAEFTDNEQSGNTGRVVSGRRRTVGKEISRGDRCGAGGRQAGSLRRRGQTETEHGEWIKWH